MVWLSACFPKNFFLCRLATMSLWVNPEEHATATIRCLLARECLRGLRQFLLGESEIFQIRNGKIGVIAFPVLRLSQNRWHRFARRLTGRANYFRQWLRLRRELHALFFDARQDLGRTESVGIGASEFSNVILPAPGGQAGYFVMKCRTPSINREA